MPWVCEECGNKSEFCVDGTETKYVENQWDVRFFLNEELEMEDSEEQECTDSECTGRDNTSWDRDNVECEHCGSRDLVEVKPEVWKELKDGIALAEQQGFDMKTLSFRMANSKMAKVKKELMGDDS